MERSTGRSEFEILVGVEATVQQLAADFHQHQLRVARDLGERPTRKELFAWFSAAGVLSGTIFGLIQVISRATGM